MTVERVLNARPRYEDIEVAPFSIGDEVVVARLTDPQTISSDHEYLDGLIGMSAKVIYYEYDCGCGQTFPGDPMIGVRLISGEINEFWAEELDKVK